MTEFVRESGSRLRVPGLARSVTGEAAARALGPYGMRLQDLVLLQRLLAERSAGDKGDRQLSDEPATRSREQPSVQRKERPTTAEPVGSASPPAAKEGASPAPASDVGAAPAEPAAAPAESAATPTTLPRVAAPPPIPSVKKPPPVKPPPAAKGGAAKGTKPAPAGGAGLPAGAAPATAAPPATLESMSTGSLALVDEELAEHQRWGAALAKVGTAGSEDRAAFILDTSGDALLKGAGMGLAMGLGVAAVAMGANALIPGFGSVIGGVLAAADLINNAEQLGKDIGGFGKGSDDYEIFANDLQAAAAVLQIISDVLAILGGVAGAVAVVAWGLTVASVGAFSPVAAMATTVAIALGLASAAVAAINGLVVQPAILMFRALHTFASEADPRDVKAQGGQIAGAAGSIGGAIGGLAAAGIAAGVGSAIEPKAPAPVQPGEAPLPPPGQGPAVVTEPGAPSGPKTVPGVGQPGPIIPEPIVVPPEAGPSTVPGIGGPDVHPTSPGMPTFPGLEPGPIPTAVPEVAPVPVEAPLPAGAPAAPDSPISQRPTVPQPAVGPEVAPVPNENVPLAGGGDQPGSQRPTVPQPAVGPEPAPVPNENAPLAAGGDEPGSQRPTVRPDAPPSGDNAPPGGGGGGPGGGGGGGPRVIGLDEVSKNPGPGGNRVFDRASYLDEWHRSGGSGEPPPYGFERPDGTKVQWGPTAETNNPGGRVAQFPERVPDVRPLPEGPPAPPPEWTPDQRIDFQIRQQIAMRARINQMRQAAGQPKLGPTELPPPDWPGWVQFDPSLRPPGAVGTPGGPPEPPPVVRFGGGGGGGGNGAVTGDASPVGGPPAGPPAGPQGPVTVDQGAPSSGGGPIVRDTQIDPAPIIGIGPRTPTLPGIGPLPTPPSGGTPPKPLTIPGPLSAAGDAYSGSGVKPAPGEDKKKDEGIDWFGVRTTWGLVKGGYAVPGNFVRGVKGGMQAKVEPVNPKYPRPPGTKEQLMQAQRDIESILGKRAAQEKAKAHNAAQKQVAATQGTELAKQNQQVANANNAVKAHADLVARRQQANADEKTKQGEVKGQLEQYADRKAALVALKNPLDLWQRATGAVMGAKWLPVSVANKFTKMNADAVRFNGQLTKLDTQMNQQIAAQLGATQKVAATGQTVAAVGQQNAQSSAQLGQADKSLQTAQQANAAKGTQAATAQASAEARSAQLAGAAAQRQAQHDTLAAQLTAWAEQHKAARQKAIDETKARMEAQAKRVTGVREK